MQRLKYEAIEAQSRDQLAAQLCSSDPDVICTALIAAALHDPDRLYVESLIMKFLDHGNPWVRGAALIAAGHVARIHRALSTEHIVPVIEKLLDDREVQGKAQDALSDIRMFVRKT